jgi:hypothetical protein
VIEKCAKWQNSLVYGDGTNLYFVRLTNGKIYHYNRREGWKERKDMNWKRDFPDDCDYWMPCSPLEVVVVCGTRGLSE